MKYMIESNNPRIKSNIKSDYTPKGKKSLSEFTKVKVTKSFYSKYKGKTKLLEYMTDNDTGYAFIDNDKNIVALVSVDYTHKNDNNNWITTIEISPKYQGYGLGKELVLYAKNNMKGNALSVDKDNKVAIELYKKCGFKISKYSEQDVKEGRNNFYYMYTNPLITESYTEQDYVLTAQLAKDKLKQYHELGRMKCITPRDIESDDGGYVFAEYKITDMKKDTEELKDYVNFINNLIEYSIYCGYVEMPKYPKSWGLLKLYPNDYPLDESKIKYFKNPDGALKNKITRKKNSNIKSGKKTNVHVSPVITKPKKEEVEDIEEGVNMFSQYLYHGDAKKYNILKPVAPDLGNALQKPGWSLFCWKDKEKAKAWAIFKSIKEKDKEYSFDVKYDPINDKIFIRNNEVNNLNKSLSENNIYAYVYTIKVPLYKVGIGNDSSIDEYTYREEVVPTKVEKIKLTKSLVSKYLDIVSEEYYNKKAQQNISNYMNNRNFIQCLLLVNDFPYNYDNNRELIDDMYWDLQVGDDIEKYIKEKGHTIKKVLPHQRIVMVLNKKKDLKSLEESVNMFSQYLYHAATEKYDVLKPTAPDLGNALRKPGWSLFCWKDKEKAKVWAILKGIGVIRGKYKNHPYVVAHNQLKDKIFIKDTEVNNLYETLDHITAYSYIYTIKVPSYKIGIGNDSCIDEYSYREEVTPVKVDKIRLTKSLVSKYLDILPEKQFEKVVYGPLRPFMNNRSLLQCVLLTNDFSYNYDNNKDMICSIYGDDELKVGDDIEKFIKSKGHTIKKVLPHQRIIMILNKKKELKSLEESSTDNIQDVTEDAKKLLYKEIVACKDGAHAYYDIMKPYVKDNAYAIVGWNVQNLQERNRSTFHKHKSAIFNYCAKIFNDTHPQYIMNMDENCIYIQKINS